MCHDWLCTCHRCTIVIILRLTCVCIAWHNARHQTLEPSTRLTDMSLPKTVIPWDKCSCNIFFIFHRLIVSMLPDCNDLCILWYCPVHKIYDLFWQSANTNVLAPFQPQLVCTHFSISVAAPAAAFNFGCLFFIFFRWFFCCCSLSALFHVCQPLDGCFWWEADSGEARLIWGLRTPLDSRLKMNL